MRDDSIIIADNVVISTIMIYLNDSGLLRYIYEIQSKYKSATFMYNRTVRVSFDNLLSLSNNIKNPSVRIVNNIVCTCLSSWNCL